MGTTGNALRLPHGTRAQTLDEGGLLVLEKEIDQGRADRRKKDAEEEARRTAEVQLPRQIPTGYGCSRIQTWSGLTKRPPILLVPPCWF